MILVLEKGVSDSRVANARRRLDELGLSTEQLRSGEHVLLLLVGQPDELPSHVFSNLEGVHKVIRLGPHSPRVLQNGHLSVRLSNGVTIGGGTPPVVIAG